MLKFLTTGNCSYTVYTAKSKEYMYKKLDLNATITEARKIQTLFVPQIQNQTDADLPKVILVSKAFTLNGDAVIPYSATPSICTPTGNSVNITSGGRCVLKFQTLANANYLASDIYTVTFDISKDGLPIVEPTPVVTPTPVATPTAKPVVKKTITCIKGKKTVKRTGTSPKCPAGYKLKK
jgi:hypothetical protein